MTTPDHAARIAEIRRQLEAATKGPWRALTDREYEELGPGVTVTPEGIADSRGEWLFESSGECTVADVVFSAAAPENIQYLLERVAELEARLNEIDAGAKADADDLEKMRDGTKLTRAGIVQIVVYQQQEIRELEREVQRLTADRDDHAHCRSMLVNDLARLRDGKPVETALAAEVEEHIQQLTDERTEAERVVQMIRDPRFGSLVSNVNGTWSVIAGFNRHNPAEPPPPTIGGDLFITLLAAVRAAKGE